MEWKVFLTIITIVTFLTAVLTPIIRLTTTITKLNSAVDDLKTYFEKYEKAIIKKHEKIEESLSQHTETLFNHDHRISCMERELKEAK